MSRYTIRDLERLLDVSVRTIHFWSQAKVLDGPGRGRDPRRYTDEHLGALILIKQLRAEGRSLGKIRTIVASTSKAKLCSLARKALSGRLDQASTTASSAAPGGAESVRERIPLAPGVELQVNRPLLSTSQELVDELVAVARRMSREYAR